MPNNNTVQSPLENIDNYISPLDNPNITLDFALEYMQCIKREHMESQLEVLNKESRFNPVLKEDLGNRCLEVLYLTNNLPDDWMVPSNVILRAIFKSALPWHRLADKELNQREFEIACEFLNRNFNDFFKHIISINDVWSQETQNTIKTVAKTICWTGSNVGQYLVNKDQFN